MDGESAPESELLLSQGESVSDGRKNQERCGIQDEYGSKSDTHGGGPGPDRRPHGGNGTPAANCRARRDQDGFFAGYLKKPLKGPADSNGQQQSHQSGSEACESGLQHPTEIHAGTKPHDRSLQEFRREGPRVVSPSESDREQETEKQGLGTTHREQHHQRYGQEGECSNESHFVDFIPAPIKPE
jgi:hypothetical protein